MATTTDKFAGLTDAQVLRLFEKIACSVELMASICRDQAGRFGEHESVTVMNTFAALDTMLCSVGAMAELATGGTMVGDMSVWMLGQEFSDLQANGGAA